jgi:pyruvate-ferredoxin/flavodoxin oxidoreductase
MNDFQIQPAVATVDGNEACADVAYRLNEVCAIYPITPSSTMAELADQWASEGRVNLWGSVPEVIEMQSEAGAAGTVHGALQGGALTTTFTASQGLMLMIPNMYKIAGELSTAVFHVAARSLAAQALSIFGDHQDVMATRAAGFGMLCSGSVQEAHDMALIAQAVSLESRIPFLHFFDGFRTSHELSRISLLSDDDLRALIDDKLVIAHRRRALNPDHPFIRGTAQNPDVYFQARETVNRFYLETPRIVEEVMERFAARTGRRYRLFDYFGHPAAERILVLMGSGAETARETVHALSERGERVGVLQVHLFRPFSAEHLLAAIPPSVRGIAVLDRTKEPGAAGEPLYQDILTAFAEAAMIRHGADPNAAGAGSFEMPRIIGGRYGLSSKEFTPAMVERVLAELTAPAPKNHFTIGIRDDVCGTSLDFDPSPTSESPDVFRAVFYGLGADGTVGANKNTIKIIGEDPQFHVQGYFVYDSKKSGSRTVSHLRFGKNPIRSTYLIRSANFIGCHQFHFMETMDVLSLAAPEGVFLLNSPYPADEVWDRLPQEAQQQICDKRLTFHVIDADRVARELGLGTRTNTIMQTCFFAISNVLPKEEAIERIKASIRKTYGSKGEAIVRQNFAAVDATLEHLHEVNVPRQVTSTRTRLPTVSAEAPDFVQQVTATIMSGRGDSLPVSALPVDGTFPSGTSRWEKRNIAQFIPGWEADLCIQCGNCGLVCPHGVIRSKLYHQDRLKDAPEGFPSAPIDARGFPETRYTLQILPDDCTGCGLCVEVCPAFSKEEQRKRAINMWPKEERLERTRRESEFFETLPITERGHVDFSTVRGTQFLEPLFEFSGACAGCGETPYLKLISQLFGDRMVVANATGCSSIYGGNLPTTPWSVNREGRGPAWSNSLFEDNAEFGLGMRLASERHLRLAQRLLHELRDLVGAELAESLLNAPQRTEAEIRQQRTRVAELKSRLHDFQHRPPVPTPGDRPAPLDPRIPFLLSVADHLVRRSVWIVGGDGWAYDIGSAGVDHVLASGRNVNLLVLDTEVYSNTGGQASKATPLAAVAKFASAGKQSEKKDLALQAIAYGNVYVARVAMGANPQQTLDAFREAEAYEGPSLILAYSHCIAHGINMQHGLDQQARAVHSGYWPLIRYNPAVRESGENPFSLDSTRPTISLSEYTQQELRYRLLTLTNPQASEQLTRAAEEAVARRWKLYEGLASLPADQ